MLKLDDFANLLGRSFEIVTDASGIPDLTLSEASALPLHGKITAERAPFSLIFDQAGSLVLPQGLYRLRQADLGEEDIFLVPMAETNSAVRYCATFN